MAETIFVELLVGFDIPQPAAIRADLVRKHDAHVAVFLVKAAEFDLEVDQLEIDAEEEPGEEIVDPERERISLGIKQLESDPFAEFVQLNDKGSIVKGTVSAVDAKAATIALNDEVEAVLKASEISRDRVEDARNALKEGEEVEAKIISIDRKNRIINLSVKSKDVEDDKQALENVRTKTAETSSGATTIGDLIKEQMQQQNANKD